MDINNLPTIAVPAEINNIKKDANRGILYLSTYNLDKINEYVPNKRNKYQRKHNSSSNYMYKSSENDDKENHSENNDNSNIKCISPRTNASSCDDNNNNNKENNKGPIVLLTNTP